MRWRRARQPRQQPGHVGAWYVLRRDVPARGWPGGFEMPIRDPAQEVELEQGLPAEEHHVKGTHVGGARFGQGEVHGSLGCLERHRALVLLAREAIPAAQVAGVRQVKRGGEEFLCRDQHTLVPPRTHKVSWSPGPDPIGSAGRLLTAAIPLPYSRDH